MRYVAWATNASETCKMGIRHDTNDGARPSFLDGFISRIAGPRFYRRQKKYDGTCRPRSGAYQPEEKNGNAEESARECP
jgi:hypothetical protein